MLKTQKMLLLCVLNIAAAQPKITNKQDVRGGAIYGFDIASFEVNSIKKMLIDINI